VARKSIKNIVSTNYFMKRTSSCLLLFICFFTLAQLTAQAQTSANSKSIDQISMIVSGLDHWIHTPKQSPQKGKLTQLLHDSTGRANLYKTLILNEDTQERAVLETLIRTHQVNKNKLMDELLLWKNTNTDTKAQEIIKKMDNIVRVAFQITQSLKNPEDYNDPAIKLEALAVYDEMIGEVNQVIPMLKKANR